MKKALGVLGDNFNTIRTGRANPAILDRIMVRSRARRPHPPWRGVGSRVNGRRGPHCWAGRVWPSAAGQAQQHLRPVASLRCCGPLRRWTTLVRRRL